MEHIETSCSSINYPTKKYMFEKDGKTVDAVYVDRNVKDIVCLSCMYGCPVKCKFCASGLSYFGRLSKGDLLYISDFIIKDTRLAGSNKKLLISFMGCGDPMLNAKTVIRFIKSVRQKFSNASFSMSLSGVKISNLKLFIKDEDMKEIKPKVQLSLHSPYNRERRKLIPLTSNLNMIMLKLEEYREAIGVEPELNYIILNGVNDSKEHAEDLARLANKYKSKLKINEYHDVGLGFKESDNKEEFIRWLGEKGVMPEIYATDGYDIGAACGQLRSEMIK